MQSTRPWQISEVTGQFTDKPTRGQSCRVGQVADWSTRGLVNSPKCWTENLEYITSLSVGLSLGRQHY